MRDKQCDVFRRELEELAPNEEFSDKGAGHLRACADCREFQRQQVSLRQIIGSLGTVNAPADFDFRLRARLAADSDRSGFRYWSFAVRGLATVAVLVVFGVGAMMIWQRTRQVETGPAIAEAPRPDVSQPEPRQTETPKVDEVSNPGLLNESAGVANNTTPRRNTGSPFVKRPKQPVASFAISSEGANVVSLSQPALDTAPVFPIDASLQSVKVSLDDGRGNARTISFPTVTFGSQRAPANANQLASKGVW